MQTLFGNLNQYTPMSDFNRRPFPLRAESKTTPGKDQLRKIPVENFEQLSGRSRETVLRLEQN
jgi:hypothetical protein